MIPKNFNHRFVIPIHAAQKAVSRNRISVCARAFLPRTSSPSSSPAARFTSDRSSSRFRPETISPSRSGLSAQKLLDSLSKCTSSLVSVGKLYWPASCMGTPAFLPTRRCACPLCWAPAPSCSWVCRAPTICGKPAQQPRPLERLVAGVKWSITMGGRSGN